LTNTLNAERLLIKWLSTAHRTCEAINIRPGINDEYPKSNEITGEVTVKLPNSMK